MGIETGIEMRNGYRVQHRVQNIFFTHPVVLKNILYFKNRLCRKKYLIIFSKNRIEQTAKESENGHFKNYSRLRSI